MQDKRQDIEGGGEMKEKATIFDYMRVCKNQKSCGTCPLGCRANGMNVTCVTLVRCYSDKANEIILKWCEEHPIKTRQGRFLKLFPNAALLNRIIKICPGEIDIENSINCGKQSCDTCKKNYWLAEVEENE